MIEQLLFIAKMDADRHKMLPVIERLRLARANPVHLGE